MIKLTLIVSEFEKILEFRVRHLMFLYVHFLVCKQETMYVQTLQALRKVQCCENNHQVGELISMQSPSFNMRGNN